MQFKIKTDEAVYKVECDWFEVTNINAEFNPRRVERNYYGRQHIGVGFRAKDPAFLRWLTWMMDDAKEFSILFDNGWEKFFPYIERFHIRQDAFRFNSIGNIHLEFYTINSEWRMKLHEDKNTP